MNYTWFFPIVVIIAVVAVAGLAVTTPVGEFWNIHPSTPTFPGISKIVTYQGVADMFNEMYVTHCVSIDEWSYRYGGPMCQDLDTKNCDELCSLYGKICTHAYMFMGAHDTETGEIAFNTIPGQCSWDFIGFGDSANDFDELNLLSNTDMDSGETLAIGICDCVQLPK